MSTANNPRINIYPAYILVYFVDNADGKRIDRQKLILFAASLSILGNTRTLMMNILGSIHIGESHSHIWNEFCRLLIMRIFSINYLPSLKKNYRISTCKYYNQFVLNL